MKKILAMLIAVMAVFSIFTACGTDETESLSNLSSKISESIPEISENLSEPEENISENSEIPEIITTEQTSQSETVSSNDEYIEAFNRLRDTVLNSDKDEFAKNILPSAVYESMKYAGILTEFSEDTYLTTDTYDFNYDSIEIISAEPIDDKLSKSISKIYMYEMLCLAEDIDDNKLEELNELFENIENTVNFESFDIVTMNIDGEEVKVCFFKCIGEEMKVELTLAQEIIEYMDKKSNENSASNIASSIYKATNSALAELNEEGIDVSGLHIICSDNSKNIVSGELADNLDSLHKKMSLFFEDIDKYDYFVVISDYCCDYSVAACDDENVGSFPKDSLVEGINGKRINLEFAKEEFADHLYDFDELYKMTINSLYE